MEALAKVFKIWGIEEFKTIVANYPNMFKKIKGIVDLNLIGGNRGPDKGDVCATEAKELAYFCEHGLYTPEYCKKIYR